MKSDVWEGLCFNRLLFILLAREIFLQKGVNMWHLTEDWRRQQQLISHLGEDTICHARLHEDFTQEHSEPSGAVGSRLCSIKRVRCPWFPQGGMDMTCLNNSTGWQGAITHYSGMCRTLPGPHDEEGYLSRGSYPQEQIKALLISWDVKATHNIEL